MAIRQNVRCDKTGVVFDVSQKRIYVKDIKKLTNAQIEVLECGDYVVKKTGLQKHTYRVSYKEEKQGICLTYTDASTSETVSYDYVDGVWTFNSQDITNLGNGTGGGSNVVANPTLSGNEEELKGLEVDGTKYKIGGGASQNASPYVISYFDVMEIAKDKVIDIDTLIAILEAKIPNFNTWTTDNGQVEFSSITQSASNFAFMYLLLNSDNHIDIYVNGDYLTNESTTNNIKQVMTLNKNSIEEVVFSTFSGNANEEYMGVVYFGNADEKYPITYDELNSLFKTPATI